MNAQSRWMEIKRRFPDLVVIVRENGHYLTMNEDCPAVFGSGVHCLAEGDQMAILIPPDRMDEVYSRLSGFSFVVLEES